MKVLKVHLIIFMISAFYGIKAQNIQLHYDIRHTLEPDINFRNFPTITFEYFKEMDSLGSFLFKIQSDMNGENNNIGQTFIQVSQNLKFWENEIYLSFNYSGGLGISQNSFGYYLTNAFAIGVAYPFQYREAWFSLNVQYRYTLFEKPSHDPQLTFYLGCGFFNYKLIVSGSLVAWMENRDQGIEFTKGLEGKQLKFFGDPQMWFQLKDGFSLGSRINLLYNLVGEKQHLKVYPTIGVQYKFQN